MMNILCKSIVTTLILLLSITKAIAADKIGLVDIQSIFQALPQAAAVQQQITEEFKDEMEIVKRLEADIKYNMEKQKRDTVTMSEQEIRTLEETLDQLRQSYAEKAQNLQQKMQVRFAEERNKILQLIRQAIDAIAAEEDFDVILNAEAAAFAKDGKDVSRKVLDRISRGH